jgi:hypothetical protein
MKIFISRHEVAKILDEIGMSKKDLYKKLGITPQGAYYRYRTGWRQSEARYLAHILGRVILTGLAIKNGKHVTEGTFHDLSI